MGGIGRLETVTVRFTDVLSPSTDSIPRRRIMTHQVLLAAFPMKPTRLESVSRVLGLSCHRGLAVLADRVLQTFPTRIRVDHIQILLKSSLLLEASNVPLRVTILSDLVPGNFLLDRCKAVVPIPGHDKRLLLLPGRFLRLLVSLLECVALLDLIDVRAQLIHLTFLF